MTNPVPEEVMPIVGNSLVWYLVWLAITTAIGKLLGKSIGGWIGLAAGGVLWCMISKSIGDIAIILVIFSLRFSGRFLSVSGLGRRIRGVKICPECAEEVKRLAKVCKFCAFKF
jgi:hypothetical protein